MLSAIGVGITTLALLFALFFFLNQLSDNALTRVNNHASIMIGTASLLIGVIGLLPLFFDLRQSRQEQIPTVPTSLPTVEATPAHTELSPTVTFTQPPPTETPLPTSTPTDTPAPTDTPIPIPTNTPTDTSIPPTPLPTLTPTPDPNVLFQDDFSGNQNGWDFTGMARLSQGKLAVFIPKGESAWIPIPTLEVPNNFYIQARVQVIEGICDRPFSGIGLGEAGGSHHRFGIDGGCAGATTISYYNNSTLLFSTRLDKKLPGDSFLIGLESKDGLYTLYVEGEATESYGITPYGSRVGFVAISLGGNTGVRDTQFTFDDLIVRESR